MVALTVGCILITISAVLFYMSYRMYTYRELLQTGKVFVRVLANNKVYYGWVMRNDITALDRIGMDRYQWFLELYSDRKYVIKIEEIKEIHQVKSPWLICFKGSMKVK